MKHSINQHRRTTSGKPHSKPPARTSASASAAGHASQQQRPASPARQGPRRRRRQTFGQRLAHLSAGAWIGIITGLLVVGIIVFAIIASSRSASNSSSAIGQLNPTHGLLATGTTAPAIGPLPAAQGGTYTLEQYKGKVVVLEFFAPWCPHCQAEAPMLNQLQQNNADKGVQVLSVSASPYGRNYEQGDTSPISMSDMQWYVTTFHLNYPALFDQSLKAANAYGVQAYPTIYVINAHGVITYAGSGEISYDGLQQQINQALNG